MALPLFPSFSIVEDRRSVGIRWTKWFKRFETYLLAYEIDNAVRKRALLLHMAGEEVQEVFDAIPETGGPDAYDTAVQKLNAYFVPKKNTDFEVLVFRRARQLEGEDIDAFCSRLQQLASTCEFENTEKEIKLQIINSCTSSALRIRALTTPNMSLSDLLQTARLMTAVNEQAAVIEENKDLALKSVTCETIARVDRNPNRKPEDDRKWGNQKCFNCGWDYPHMGGVNNCPARHVFCRVCNQKGHFARCCKQRGNIELKTNQKVNFQRKDYNSSSFNGMKNYVGAIETTDPESSDESIFLVAAVEREQIWVSVDIDNQEMRMLVDTGAAVNIIGHSEWKRMQPLPSLDPVLTSFYGFGSQVPLKMKGSFVASLTYKVQVIKDTVYVPILGLKAILHLQVIHLNNVIKHEGKHINMKELQQMYPKVFQGVGKLKGHKVKLHIDKNVIPVAQHHRRVPYHMREAVSKELNDLLSQDIIEKVAGPTPWVSPIVVIPKVKDPGNVRICVDMRVANQAIQRERHVMPLLDDALERVNGAKVFSRIDLNKAFHQLELEEESRDITVFSTHEGLFRYKRLFFGVNAAPEICQNITRQIVSDITGAEAMQDDLLIFGRNDEEHDKALHAVFQKLDSLNLTVKTEKCDLYMESLDFYGYTLTKDGVSPDFKKVSAIRDLKDPENVKELRIFLGTVGYLIKFIRNFATLVDPLRRLLRKNATWNWQAPQIQAMVVIKTNLKETPTLAFLMLKKDTV